MSTSANKIAGAGWRLQCSGGSQVVVFRRPGVAQLRRYCWSSTDATFWFCDSQTRKEIT
jgi:hypothetical protein